MFTTTFPNLSPSLEPNVQSSEVISGLVLIVDDTPTNLEVISEALSDAGFDVAIAISGDRALQQLERRLPDLILLDVMMPGIDGFETCRRIKANPHTQHIPVIFMTALADSESKVKALELGAVDYVAKPFHEKEVIARVRTHLQLSHLTQTLADQVNQKNAELQATQLQIVQSEKMSALGNLVAGVAHEINNPIGCVVGNVTAVEESITDLFDLIDLYRQKFPQPGEEIEDKLETIDLDYLREDLPKLVKAMRDGGDRIKAISKSLRNFSRSDTDNKQQFNIHEGIDSTVLILRHRLKANEHRPEIGVITEYGKIPDLDCFPGPLNQVFMNILANAIDALDESNQGRHFTEIAQNPNLITIRTALEAYQVKISISDNGKGMSETVKARIFDHAFTTKKVGQGTGLGLAIAHQIIVEKHGGTIEVHSEPGQGTEFVLTLPLGH
ncbi:MAG: hybrid sensor histidine kinase/response regulator [Oculatellaceae cyanobacterium Prado106]|jgi:signal transduction histidine kinase|nr:hybrid sensor histidine kinase/response regulator [Oculatellaceae cyanobacterium Prado106]